MNSARLFEFFNQVKVWPKSQSEFDLAAQGISRLFEVKFIGIFSSIGEKRIGIDIAGSVKPEGVQREKLEEVISSQFEMTQADGLQFKRLELAPGRSGLNWPVLSSVTYLVAVPLIDLNGRDQKGFGWIVVGSTNKLNPIEESFLLVVSQRLSDLARIAQLEADVQIRNQFLSIASHELKTPLTSIYGILQLQERMLRLKKGEVSLPDQERHHNFLKMVIRQVERLNELIDGLLDVSRIQNGRFMVEPTSTDVAALLKDVVQTRLSVVAQEAGVKLHLESPLHLIGLVDPVRMEEVITNLVMNAIRFSPEGGVVWIRLREEGGAFRLTVRDQGPSIPMEDRERIFQPFERAQRTSRMGGLGLGLFISRQIALLHGGNVSLVESVPGKGNVFEAYFPLRNSQQVSA